ncbi:MAG TPA: hypothetical protein VIL30_03315 [Ramlibacter sp.]|jgi:hypothetical protein
MKNKTILGGLIAASLLGFGAAANAQYTAIVSVAPPAPQYEVVPAPRQGYVWAPGHYEWRGNQHVWVQGQWLSARNGYDYREPRWVQRGNGEWVLVGNTWERRGPNGDRDGDGIANRYDRDRNGDGYADNRRRNDLDRDGVPNARDRDRDGDGVPNHRDQFPDDNRRS